MAVENFLIEEDEDALAEADCAGRLIVKCGAARSTGIVPLAFTIEENLAPVVVSGLALSWSREARAVFRRLRDAHSDPTFKRNLPYASLRGLMEATLPSVARITRSMGLDHYALNPQRPEAEPFIYLESSDARQAQQDLRSLLDNWIVSFLVPQYIEPGGVSFDFRDELLGLSRTDGLVQIEPMADRLLPWTSGPTGTASPPDKKKRGFQLLVDQAARCVAGEELFTGLGPMRRIVTVAPGSQSEAQLITQPIETEHGLFSLLVSLEVVTFPSLGQPLITVRVSKRHWLARISERTADRHAISGSVFSVLRPERAVSFSVCRERGPDSEWHWMPDNAYEALKWVLKLPLALHDGAAILRGEANTSGSRVLLVHRDSISEGRNRIKRGVPELDKLEAFEGLKRALTPIGLVPFRGYQKVVARHRQDHEEAARTINPSTLLNAALEALEPEAVESPPEALLRSLDDKAIDQLLRRQFKIGLEQIQKGHRIVHFQGARGGVEADQSLELDTLIRANTDAVKRMYGESRPQLMIFHENGADTALRIVKAVARLLWGEAIEIHSNKLPPGAHGPKGALEGSDQKDAVRSRLRVEAWRPFGQQLAAMKRRTFCLVMAPDRFRDPHDPTRAKRDDRINKAAGRQALATIARASVQYLLPPAVGKDSDTIDLGDFLHRIQAALRDLVSAHSGRFDGLAQAVASAFSAVPAMHESAPKEVLGLTVVRKMEGRARGGIGTTFLPVALRLDVATGRCDMRFAHESASGLTISPWEPFFEALSAISKISPVRLAEKRDVARTRFERFTEQIISESVDADARPVVLVDSTNCVQLWPWLADARLDAANIQIGGKQWMEKTWKGARIIRIRQNLSPAIAERKEQAWADSSPEDRRERASLPSELTTAVPTSPVGLFRLTSAQGTAGATCYLSVGHKTLHMEKRGPSCYRKTLAGLPYSRKVDGSEREQRARNEVGQLLFALGERPPFIGQWPTPKPLEIVVTLRQPGDDPDRLAELVERLRYGFGHYSDWTSLPAPLFFERVVRDYVSGFTIEDESEPNESEDEEA